MKLTSPIQAMFTFPIRIFDGHSAKKAKQEFDTYGTKEPIDYIIGQSSVPFGEVRGWHDSFLPHRDIADVKERGFDSTVVITHTMGEFLCSWKRERFEANFESYMLKMEAHFKAVDEEESRRPLDQPYISGLPIEFIDRNDINPEEDDEK